MHLKRKNKQGSFSSRGKRKERSNCETGCRECTLEEISGGSWGAGVGSSEGISNEEKSKTWGLAKRQKNTRKECVVEETKQRIGLGDARRDHPRIGGGGGERSALGSGRFSSADDEGEKGEGREDATYFSFLLREVRLLPSPA